MNTSNPIPIYTRYGETDDYPDVVHSESFSARAPLHNWRIAAHRHANMGQVFLCVNGQIDANIDGTPLTVKDREFLFLPADYVHEFKFQPGTLGQVISIPNAVMNGIAPATEHLRAALATPFSGPFGDDLQHLATALDRACLGAETFRTQSLVSLAHGVLACIASTRASRENVAQNRPQQRLQKLDSLIAQHMTDGWGASDYANALAVSTGHLSRVCRSGTGLGAAAYIEQRVLQEACRMLAFTQLPVSDIGYRLGFSDPSYFSKRFQKALRCTPTAYRAQFVQ